jgi:hypothetical protein
MLNEHNHLPEPEHEDGLLALQEMLSIARISNDNPRTIMKTCQQNVPTENAAYMCRPVNIRQRINRIRRLKVDHGANPEDRRSIRISSELSRTIDGELFLLFDDNDDDDNDEMCDCDTDRILAFATEKNFIILNKNPHWFGDGTFDVSPLLFKQLYTINVIESGKNLPMIFALLPNKKGETYERLFEIIKIDIQNDPKSIMLDFEKAAINAVSKWFPLTFIMLCYFHLCQNLWKNVQNKGLVTGYSECVDIRKNFKMLKCLAFVPTKDVIFAFKEISRLSVPEFEPMLTYLKNFTLAPL